MEENQFFKVANKPIVIDTVQQAIIDNGTTFYSHDRGTAKIDFFLKNEGVAFSIPQGTLIPIRLTFPLETAEDGLARHDYLAVVDDPVNGHVHIVLEDNILGYQGVVEGSVYVNFPNQQSLDTAGRFRFRIQRSPLEETTNEIDAYYFNGFNWFAQQVEELTDSTKQEIEKLFARANDQSVSLEEKVKMLDEKINQTEQQINELGNLKRMYSNSIDFGNYDYSGNANLLPKITAGHFTSGNGATVEDGPDGEIIFTLDGSAQLTKFNTSMRLPALQNGKRYTISAEIMLHEGLEGDASNIRLTNTYVPGGNIMLSTVRPLPTATNIWHTISGTQIATYATTLPQQWYVVLQDVTASSRIKGKISLRNIKIEEGSVVTPYQPNLHVEPYHISKVPLNENLANKEQAFPISSRQYLVYSAEMIEPFIANQTYALTLKGTKLGTQSFRVYTTGPNSTSNIGDMEIVEGVADTWRLTFTPTSANLNGSVSPSTLQIYQFPQATMGQVTIDSVKIEKGNTATPNISKYKYFGEGLKDSNNPYDYSWDVTPEYTEKRLNDKVSLTEPQAIEGTKDFLEQPFIEGERISTETFGISLIGGRLVGVPVSNGTVLNWGNPYAYDNERSKTNDLFTLSEDNKTLTILKNCALQFVGKFTCQTNDDSYHAYLGMRVNGASDWRVAGIAGSLNWRNDVGWFCVRKFNAGERVTLVTETNFTTASVNNWGVDQVYIKEVLAA
ncbi:BppU family phage baseplate upper protein [Enterococcus mundtii]|uniref:BppU family phage baseplate upper protein n=1 Tax=Enterococcus mundtii TaxID=53346 RepID=UPI0029530716|nr:BppU family phage baseplate upper protein [Enterococcus mundtii]MDV7743664.1 BppU family phage baseplate upper protein [Enterococcus mundtii]